MIGGRFRFFLFPCVFLVVLGCATAVPKEVVDKVTYYGDFASLQKSPDRFIGEFVILGGKVVETKNDSPGSGMIVVQFPLDRSYRPQVNEPSQGRFLVRSDTFLDPAVYSPGSLVTVAGTMAGKDVRQVGEYPYVYPVLNITRIWKWEPGRESYPRFMFGIGIGTSF